MVLLDQGATWTGVGVLALSALLLALGILLFARWRRVAEREAALIRAAGERTEKLLTELSRALGDARDERGRLAALGELGATLDLDAALERALRVVSQLADAEAAMIILRQEEGEPITAGQTLDPVAREVAERLLDGSAKVLTILLGEETPEAEGLVDALRGAYPGVEIEVHEGGQPHYPLLFGAE